MQHTVHARHCGDAVSTGIILRFEATQRGGVMGLDGGTIISRNDVLRGASWRLSQADGSRSSRGGAVSEVYRDPALDDATRRAVVWSTCALSGLPLAPPLVADEAGQLFNRSAIVEHLAAARALLSDAEQDAAVRHANTARSNAFDHITSLRDVFAVHLTCADDRSPEQQSTQMMQQQKHKGVGVVSTKAPRWLCPITLLPAGGRAPFSALRRCGHVLSDKALGALAAGGESSSSNGAQLSSRTNDAARAKGGVPAGGSASVATAAAGGSRSSSSGGGGRCPVCEHSYSAEEVVRINGSQEYVDAARAAARSRAAARAAARAAKRTAGSDTKTGAGSSSSGKRARCAALEASAAGASAPPALQ